MGAALERGQRGAPGPESRHAAGRVKLLARRGHPADCVLWGEGLGSSPAHRCSRAVPWRLGLFLQPCLSGRPGAERPGGGLCCPVAVRRWGSPSARLPGIASRSFGLERASEVGRSDRDPHTAKSPLSHVPTHHLYASSGCRQGGAGAALGAAFLPRTETSGWRSTARAGVGGAGLSPGCLECALLLPPELPQLRPSGRLGGVATQPQKAPSSWHRSGGARIHERGSYTPVQPHASWGRWYKMHGALGRCGLRSSIRGRACCQAVTCSFPVPVLGLYSYRYNCKKVPQGFRALGSPALKGPAA